MNNLIPKVRFKEFKDEWQLKELGDFTKINQGLQIPISERLTEKIAGSYFYITNEFLKKDSKKAYYIKDPPASVLCNETDLLMTRTGNTGQVVTGVSGAFHNNFFKIKLDEDHDRWFLYYFLTSHKTQHTILKLAGTSTIPDLNHGDFYKIRIHTPRLPEQQQIASFLSAVDEKIQQLTRKKELLEQYKKGVMQQLFSSSELGLQGLKDDRIGADENNPSIQKSYKSQFRQLRFKDKNGKSYPKWEERRLSELGDFKGGGTPSTNIEKYWKGDIPWISSSDIIEDDIQNIKINRYINQEAVNDSATKLIPSGSFMLVSRVGVGKLAISKVDLCTSQDFTNFIPRDCNSYYLGYLLIARKNFLINLAQGTSIKGFTTEDVKALKVPVPHLNEQQKIAGYLTSLDAKIESVAAQIAHTQTFKKGLLQQMFV